MQSPTILYIKSKKTYGKVSTFLFKHIVMEHVILY